MFMFITSVLRCIEVVLFCGCSFLCVSLLTDFDACLAPFDAYSSSECFQKAKMT